MKNHLSSLEPDCLYHIYNRGINSGKIFFSEKNYYYFLKLLLEKVSCVSELKSYCLLPNHFHILVKIKSEDEIRVHFSQKEKISTEKIISQQFSNTFNSYSQAINKHYGRTGKLFELPFRRKHVITENQLINSILYINCNPYKHKIKDNPKDYPFSSLNEILADDNRIINTKEILELFSGTENFKLTLSEYMQSVVRA